MNRRLFQRGRRLSTLAHGPAGPFYGERLHRNKAGQWRQWRPDRSKLSAYLLKERNPFSLAEDATVLYLGAARGGTVSHVSDLVPDGRVLAVEPSPVELVGLLRLARKRDNVHPLPIDARRYGLVQAAAPRPELLYQDVAQRDQVGIFLRTAEACQPRQGLLALKARSVQVQEDPMEMFRQAVRAIEAEGHTVHHVTPLGPEQKDHAMIAVTFQGPEAP